MDVSECSVCVCVVVTDVGYRSRSSNILYIQFVSKIIFCIKFVLVIEVRYIRTGPLNIRKKGILENIMILCSINLFYS